ncbi:MAG: FHA domain-containing protein [Chloroflexi bacterium]|nr:FHA domain-containing protein [Chloroflexota bacterium]
MKRFLLIVFALCLLSATTFAQQSARITLVDAPTVSEDRISLGVRVTGVDPRQLAALTAANFSVSEPFIDLQVAAEPRLPLTLGVLVNLSVNSELPLLQGTLRAYFDSYYREGDEVTFMLLTGRAPSVVSAANRAEVDAVIDSMAVSQIYFSVGDALSEFAGILSDAQAAAPERVVLGLLVTAFINNAGEVPSADSFAEVGIPLHVVQAHNFREGFTENLREMATRGGGIFVNNQAGALVTGDTPAPVGALKVLFDAIESTRLIFGVSYTSNAIDLTLEPSITLTLQVSADEVLGLPFTYQRQFDPPVVEFANPSLSAARRPSRLDAGGTAFDVDGQDVAVFIRYPDSAPRSIKSLELQVTDIGRSAVVQSLFLVDPQPDTDGAYHVRWDLSDYVSPGTNTPVSIVVSVTDELGLIGRAEQTSGVTVAALPPLPTSTPLPPTATFTPVPPTLVPTAIPPTAVPTTQPTVAQGLFEAGQNTLLGRTLPISVEDLAVALSIITVALVGITAALLLRIRRIRRQYRTHIPMYSDSRMEIPTPLPSGDAPQPSGDAQPNRVLGRLIVKRGLPKQEIPINATEFVVGRTAGEGIQYAIDAPFISPRHCMITFRNNRFLIRDLGSKNGTFVNGERILPERDTIVPNGSEVEITRQVVFELWDPDTVVRVDYQMDDARTERLNSRISTTTADSVSFPSALGIRAADDDDGEIGEDYSPV